MDLVECPPKIQHGNTIKQTSLQALHCTCIWDMLALNLGQNTGYHYQGSSCFSLSPCRKKLG